MKPTSKPGKEVTVNCLVTMNTIGTRAGVEGPKATADKQLLLGLSSPNDSAQQGEEGRE